MKEDAAADETEVMLTGTKDTTEGAKEEAPRDLPITKGDNVDLRHGSGRKRGCLRFRDETRKRSWDDRN